MSLPRRVQRCRPEREPALILLLLLSCGFIGCHDTDTRIRYVDPIATGEVTSSVRRPEMTERSCAEQTFFVLEMQPGEEISLAAPLLAEPSLVLSGCAKITPAASKAATVEITVSTTAAGRPELHHERRITFDSTAWTEHRLDLGAFAASTVRVRLTGDLPQGARLFLKELTVEHHESTPESRPRHPPTQVLLISIDTLRADALGAMGGTATTPHLDRFAKSSETWSASWAAASWTKPSHASLLSGYYPWYHGAKSTTSAINPKVRMLAERFRDGGFATAGLVFDCAWLEPKIGFARGFDEYRVVPWRCGRMARWASNWIADHQLPTREVHIVGMHDPKWTVPCDVYLDDSPFQIETIHEHRRESQMCRYVRPWNSPVPGVHDIHDWEEFEELVTLLEDPRGSLRGASTGDKE